MKKTLCWIALEYLRTKKVSPSSKRFIGVSVWYYFVYHTLFVLTAIVTETLNQQISLVNAVAMLAFGCLGLASVDKIWGKRNLNNTDNIDNKEN
jgi:hypothetical protein